LPLNPLADRQIQRWELKQAALAARLRSETTLTMKWIAVWLHLGTWKSAASAGRSGTLPDD
jgi:hypothetical protein